MNANEYFQLGVDEKQKLEIQALIEQRSEAKKQKDYTKADEIRSKLESMGIMILDTAEGSVWEKA